MNGLTVTGSLLLGFEVDGITYRDFTMRPAILRDSCVAVELVGGDATPNIMRYATMAQRLVFVGLAQEKVTVDLLMGLIDRDALRLEAASDEIEKKLDALSSS